MEIHFIRHGETDWNATRRIQGQMESSLTETGRSQARALAERLKDTTFDQVFCSSSRRARETAEILFPQPPGPILYQDELREIRLGPWEGNLYEDITCQYPEQMHYFRSAPHLFSLPDAETFQQLQDRGLAAIRPLREKPADRIAVVSHGALIKAILCHFDRRPLANLWDPPQLHNCAHSIVEFDSNGNGLIRLYAGVPATP